MPFSALRVGQYVGGRADRFAISQFLSDNPEAITLAWNGNAVKYTLWSLLPNGNLLPTELKSHAGGPDLSVACFSKTRAVSMYRSGPAGALKFEAWETGAIFELSDDAAAPADRDPDIATFGGTPGILSVPPGGLPVSVAKELEPDREQADRGTGIQVPQGNIVVKLSAKAGHAVVASITTGNHVRVSLWGFDNGGDYKVLAGKGAEADGGPATAACVVKVKETWAEGPTLKGAEVVTASRGEGYALTLQRWRVTLSSQGTPASIQLLGSHTAAEHISHVAAAPVVALGGTQVATAVRLDDGRLKVIGWKMESGGGISRWVDVTGGQIGAVSAAAVRSRDIVTAVREGDGRFKTSYWRFPAADAGAVEHRGDAVEGPVGLQMRCAHVPGQGTQLGDTIAATQTEDGKLQLFRYRVTDA